MDNDYICNFSSVKNFITCMGPILLRWNIYIISNFNRNFKIVTPKIIAARYGGYFTNFIKCLRSYFGR